MFRLKRNDREDIKMDKNGKIFGKISIIDLLVVVIVIVGAIGFAMRFLSIESKNVTVKTNLEYVIEVEDVRSYTVDALNKKGTLINTHTGDSLGEIINVESEPYTEQEILSNGRTVVVKVPEKYKVRVTAKCEGKETDKAFFAGKGQEIAVGSSINVVTKYASTNGKVISVKKIG